MILIIKYSNLGGQGRFVISRTATNGVPPGAFYPTVTELFESLPGTQTNVSDIFLPLVTAGTLQPVSQAQDTMITFPPSVLEAFPEFAGTQFTIPADSLFADNGTRGGMVGIAPVPPDRLPGPLPPGLEFPLVITVQTNGATNFDVPAPVCFPNLPDPATGERLPAGTQNFLYSFNHDIGRFGPVGPMTVSSDGALICTDPGVGIQAPGWHGTGPPPFFPPFVCPRFGNGLPRGINDLRLQVLRLVAKAFISLRVLDGLTAPAIETTSAYLQLTFEPASRGVIAAFNTILTCTGLQGTLQPQEFLFTDPTIMQLLQIAQQLVDLVAPHVRAEAEELPANVVTQINTLIAQAGNVAGGDTVTFLERQALNLEEEMAAPALELDGDLRSNAPPYPILFVAEIVRTDGSVLILRGETGPLGQYNIFVPRDGTLRSVSFYDPRTRAFGSACLNLRRNARFALPPVALVPVDTVLVGTDRDVDNDGLPTLVELVYGTNPYRTDNDEDGISDGAEIEQGTNPLDGLVAPTGIIASAETPGTAVDIAAFNNLVAVAGGAAGVSVFNVFNGMNPTIIAQVDTPGTAGAVAGEAPVIAVADGDAGLAIIDIADPATAHIRHQVALNGNAQAIAVADGVAYVGTAEGLLAAVDPFTGGILEQIRAPATIHDLVVDGTTLFVLHETALQSYTLAQGTLTFLDSAATSDFRAEGITGRKRLFVGDGVAYTTSFPGFDTFDVSNPAAIRQLGSTQNIGPNSFKHLVANGSGLGIATVGVNPRNDGTHHLSLYDISNPADTTNFQTQFETPGVARAVNLFNALAYVADSDAGMQVINYLPYDAQGEPPTVVFTTTPNGEQVEEGARLRVDATVTDDVQVRNVELLLDGEVVAIDGNFPFQFFLNAPGLDVQEDFTLTVLATDTGGNQATSARTFTLPLDTTPPMVIATTPRAGGIGFAVSTINVTLNESLDINQLSLSGFTLQHLGADGLLGGDDDTPVTLAGVESVAARRLLIMTQEPLSPGNYQLDIATAVIADAAGNTLAEPFSLFFTSQEIPPPNTPVWVTFGDGARNDPNNWSTVTVPGRADHVIIDRLGTDLTVNIADNNFTVGSPQTTEALIIDTMFTVAEGASQVDGPPTITRDTLLIVDGNTTSFLATDATDFDGAPLLARNGGTLELPGATTYTTQGGNPGWEANGAGSVIDLHNLTQVTATVDTTLFILARAGGRIDLSNLTQLTPPGVVEVQADGPDSVIDLSSLSTVNALTAVVRLRARNGGTILLPNLITLQQGIVELQDPGSILDLSPLTSFDGSGLLSRNGATLVAPNVTTYATLTGNPAWEANSVGSVLNLRSFTQVTATGGTTLFIRALAGGRVDLSNVTRFDTPGAINVSADGLGSVVDLSTLAAFDETRVVFRTTNGGSIILP